MPNRSADSLFQLIKSLEKAEKRNFKLYMKRHSGADNLKTVQLFDALDKLQEYDEPLLLKKNQSISKQQLSNLKASLYKQLLSSLRLIRDVDNIDIQLHEQLDFARILFNKGLYLQTLRLLEKLKEVAYSHQQYTFIEQAVAFEKKIEALYITRSIEDRAARLAVEATALNEKNALISALSNLSLQLYSWYIQNGHARNEKDLQDVKEFYNKNIPQLPVNLSGFYEELYYHQSRCWYAYVMLDFVQFYRHSAKWVNLFDHYPQMLEIEAPSFIKGMHNLMSAHFALLNVDKLAVDISRFKKFAKHKVVVQNDNNRILTYQYLYTAQINYYFLQGTFGKGLRMVPFLEQMLQEYGLYLDTHRVLVFYYKIACLYFGSGDNERAIDYLNRIINQRSDLRTDLQCYSRLLHLIAHYELGNFDLLEYLSRSVYRFMAKMENLSKVEEEMFRFLKRSFKVGAHAIKPEFQRLLKNLRQYEKNPLEARAFAYLDVISWLESKINGVHVQDVIRDKYQKRKKNKPVYDQ